MDPITQQQALAAAGAGGAGEYVDDVFSTFLYDGNGGTQSINNGIDLSGEGGMVWLKRRNTGNDHYLGDTVRGVGKILLPNESIAELNTSVNSTIKSFDSSGFTVGGNSGYNGSSDEMASWTFRKAPGFFDVVTFTGNSTAGRTVAHNLGSVPGCVIVKRIDGANGWGVYHKNTVSSSSTQANNLVTFLNGTPSAGSSTAYWNDTTPTSSVFTLGNDALVNGSGMEYVAYVFASEEPVFGADGDESIIKCGSYTGNGTANHAITVGFEPQWLLVKNTTQNAPWLLMDTMRGMPASYSRGKLLKSNTNDSEVDGYIGATSTGFNVQVTGFHWNASGNNYIYIAIRRPNKPPETSLEVLASNNTYGGIYGGSSATKIVEFPTPFGGVTDMAIFKQATYNNTNWVTGSRLLGPDSLLLNSVNSSSTGVFGTSVNPWDQQHGVEVIYNDDTNRNGRFYNGYLFTRKSKVFDVVAYTGQGSDNSIAHNLGVIPEMIWVKNRTTGSTNWAVYHAGAGITKEGALNTDAAFVTGTMGGYGSGSIWYTNPHPNGFFYVSNDVRVNASGDDYIAYLFATLPGISKVGSYTGTGNNINVDCGFTEGVRFLMIKRTDSAGDWYTFSTSGASFLKVNRTDASNNSFNYMNALNAGFTITSSAGSDLNASGGTYVFLAISGIN